MECDFVLLLYCKNSIFILKKKPTCKETNKKRKLLKILHKWLKKKYYIFANVGK